MLGKLIKYDFKNNFKFLIIFYILALFFAVLTRIFLNIDDSFILNIIGKVCSGTTIAMIFNILFNFSLFLALFPPNLRTNYFPTYLK